MNHNNRLYAYLKPKLIEWKPKTTPFATAGVGFNDSNIKETDGSLPSTTEYDYVFVAPPISDDRSITTGANRVQRSTQTYVIEIYTLRQGLGAIGRQKTIDAMYEVENFIKELLAPQGFILSTGTKDLNYMNNGTTRNIIKATKTFVL